MEWLNLFPLIKDSDFVEQLKAKQENILSVWLPIRQISYFSMSRMEEGGKYVVEIAVGNQIYKEAFNSWEDAYEAWKALQGALGIRKRIKKGQVKKIFEDFPEE